MKVKHASLILAGILCMAAPAWTDTFSPSDTPERLDSSFRYTPSPQFAFSQPGPEYRIAWDFRKAWDGWDRDHHDRDRDTSEPPVDPTPEPPAVVLLASGLLGLLGSAWLRSLRRSRPAS
jgi:hypothetical protein